jgi:hypothetical protein
VDDYLDSFATPAEAIEIYNQVTNIHNHAGFEIRNFVTNSSVVRANIPHHLLNEQLIDMDLNPGTTEKVLGMSWKFVTDELV